MADRLTGTRGDLIAQPLSLQAGDGVGGVGAGLPDLDVRTDELLDVRYGLPARIAEVTRDRCSGVEVQPVGFNRDDGARVVRQIVGILVDVPVAKAHATEAR